MDLHGRSIVKNSTPGYIIRMNRIEVGKMNDFDWNKCIQDNDKLLVLLAGQSNMAGRGLAEAEDLRPVPGLLTMRPDLQWVPAVEPITHDRDFIGTFSANGEKINSADPFEVILPQQDQKVIGVGLGRTFGRLLAEANPGRTVGLLPCAVGGTSISAWMPGGVDDWDPGNFPYDNAIKRAKEAQKSGKIVAVLWHQGETDAQRHTPEYQEKLQTVIQNFRRDLSLDETVPFIAGDMASFYVESIAPHIELVDNALAAIAANDPTVRIVRTKDLMHRGDKLHYNTPSLHELGERYYREYVQFKANPPIRIFADCESVIAEGPFYSHTDKKVYWVNPGSFAHDGMPGCILCSSGENISRIEAFDPGVDSVSAFSQQQDGTFLLFAKKCRIWRWQPGRKAGLLAELPGEKFKFNDVTTTSDGHVFCTVLPENLNNGVGELYDFAPDGSFKLLDTCKGIPNGMGFSPDGKTFYFTATTEKTLYRYDYSDGKISGKAVFAAGIDCDGLAVDTEGCVWSAGWFEKIRRFDPTGKLINEWTLPGVTISSLCFGGAEMNDIYMTTANYPHDRSGYFRTHAGCVLVWKNSPFKGLKIPFFA